MTFLTNIPKDVGDLGHSTSAGVDQNFFHVKHRCQVLAMQVSLERQEKLVALDEDLSY
jgi:hypothetical protein